MQTIAQLPGGGHGYRFDPSAFISPEALANGLKAQPKKLSDDLLLTAAERVGEAYRAMKRDQKGLPAAWLPTGEWQNYLEEKNSLCGLLARSEHQKAAELFGNFWRDSELGPIVKEYATFEALNGKSTERTERFKHNIVRNWLIWKELTGADTQVLETPNVGNVWGYEIDGVVVAPKACRYHHLASEMTAMTQNITHPVVAEIGGGYGGLAEFYLRRNSDASWVNYDLPETSVMASFFLIGAQGAGNVNLYGEVNPIKRKSQLSNGSAYIMPNYALRDLENESVDVFVNMFSLSEVGPEPLKVYLKHINEATAGWFVHHNMDRPGVINRGHERIPSSTFAASLPNLPMVATGFDHFHGTDGDYRWYIHKR